MVQKIYVRPGVGQPEHKPKSDKGKAICAARPVLPRHPHTLEQLPAEGAYWEDSPFLRRRLRDGDIVKADPPKDIPATKSKVKAQSKAKAGKGETPA